MKFIIASLLFLSLFASDMVSAQNRKDEIKARKVEYITSKLDLSVEEAEKFWPIYNEFQDKKKNLRKERRALKPDKSFDEMNDQEIETLMDKHFEYKQKELNLEKEYMNKFKTVLPIKKVAKLRIVEEQFKKELLKRLKENRSGRPSQRGPR